MAELWNAIWQRIGAIWDEQSRRLRAALAPAIAQLRARYQRLESREKVLVQVAAALAAIFVTYNLIYVPVQNLTADLQDRIEARQRDLVDVQRLASAYAQRKLDLAGAEKHSVTKAADFSLFSTLEASVSKTLSRDKIGAITPSDRKVSNELTEYTVELKLNDVSLDQLVDALYNINGLQVPVQVRDLHIKRRAQNTQSYDVDMTCVALARNG